ncbi:hypothetical protein [Enterovibrio norvegicus]|uniref:Uncharacterized protein n=1 Tax=Enterovibrio norvegicus DSM 15893 TaxID=1121869 RepID=A0A1I5P8Z4_9GAMM|nr:hypothetical protein [Enterovibrio norvegicus]SFP30578.1 hypothetical protein SAMN03084138_01844 [Enterovibrio norvegicus DSM 15893]
MDIENLASGSAASTLGWVQASTTELTGFCGPTHYHMQRLLGEDSNKQSVTNNEEWPTHLPTSLC